MGRQHQTNRYIYSSSADFSAPPFFNADLLKPGEITSYDGLLNPKWRGQNPVFRTSHPKRRPRSFGFLDENQGQGIFTEANRARSIYQPRRQATCRCFGKTHTIALGLSQRFVDPYINAGIPIKPLMPIKEGLSGSNGFGTVAVMKNAPHPNASKVYINWLLGKEGQDLYGKALTPGTRRFDVDTKWLAKIVHPQQRM